MPDLKAYTFAYTVYVENAVAAEHALGFPDMMNSTDGTTLDTATALANTFMACCSPLSPVMALVEPAPFAGTELPGWAPELRDGTAPTCWKIVFGGTVQATHRTDSHRDWEGSANAIVEQNSFEGTAHGWDWDMISVKLDILEAT